MRRYYTGRYTPHSGVAVIIYREVVLCGDGI